MDQRIGQDEAPEGRPNFRADDGTMFIYNSQRGVYEPYKHSDENRYSRNAKASGYPRRRFWKHWNKHWQFWITTAMSILTLAVVAVYTYYAMKQVVASEGATRETKNAVKVAGDTLQHTKDRETAQDIIDGNSREQARKDYERNDRLAQKSLQATIGNFHREQRAWLEVIPEISKPLPQPEGIKFPPLFDYRFSIKNTGKTAARLTYVGYNNRGVPNGEDSKRSVEDFQNKSLLPTPSPTVLVPGSDFPWALRGIMQTSSKLPDGRLLLNQYLGRVEYKDVFGVSHWLTFCYELHDDATPALCEFGNNQGDKPPATKN